MSNDITALIQRLRVYAEEFSYPVLSPDDCRALVEALEKAQRANAAQDDHINQQQHRIDTLERRNAELGKYAGELESRTVTLPEVRITIAESKRRGMTNRELNAHNAGALEGLEIVSKTLVAAGIQVIEGEQNNG